MPVRTLPTSATEQAPRRALAPDLARGVMIGLIAIANVSAYLWGTVDETAVGGHPTGGSALDSVLSVLTILVVDGRVYPMFAFLFGYSIIQFTRNRIARGDDGREVGRMLLRRNLWLLVFGLVHALLLFSGDVLGAYGLAGLILGVPLLRGSDRALKTTVWVLGGITALFSLGMVLLTAATAWLMGDPALMQDGDLTSDDALIPPSADGTGFFDGVMSFGNSEPNYAMAMLMRAVMWVGGTVFANLMLIVPLCIILGALAARHLWIETRPADARSPHLGLIACLGIGIGIITAIPQALSFLGIGPALLADALIGINQLGGMAAGIGYVALFGAIGARLRNHPPKLLLPIAWVGQRSLSFYLLQSVVFAPLLAAWGFGLGRTWSTTSAFALAAAVWLVSLGLAALCARTNHKGPAEVVLRRLTYGRRAR